MNFNFNESTSRTVKHDGHAGNNGKDFHLKNVVYFACTVPQAGTGVSFVLKIFFQLSL